MPDRHAEWQPGQLLAVTTRSKLRGVRFFPVMLLATLRVRRQLARTDGLVRWASLIAGATEFWTITVWRSRHAMQEFARSEAHGEIMWRFSHWLRSLWIMRWRAGPDELGSWAGMRLSAATQPENATEERPAPDWTALQQVLCGLPSLRSALGPDAVARYDSSRPARRSREQVAGGGGVVIRVSASRLRAGPVFARLLLLRRRLGGDAGMLRSAVGIGRPGAIYFFAVWRDAADATRFVHSEWACSAKRRWGEDFWALAWLPENEFGHWDGMRLRQQRHRTRRGGEMSAVADKNGTAGL